MLPEYVKSSVGSCTTPLIVTKNWSTSYPVPTVIVVALPLPSSVALLAPDDNLNVSLGNVIVLSAVGSVTVRVVSKLFAVLPSNTMFPPRLMPALKVVSPAALPSIVTKVVSELPSVPFMIMSVSLP